MWSSTSSGSASAYSIALSSCFSVNGGVAFSLRCGGDSGLIGGGLLQQFSHGWDVVSGSVPPAQPGRLWISGVRGLDLSHHPLDPPQFSSHRAGLIRQSSGILVCFSGLEERGFRLVSRIASLGSVSVDVLSRSD
ncbi:uncharacterized protein LOC110224443 [Arabidopsis lyrata subsp. lyrata]|uniref:uncharacterized protein LOC110224443 n=1 Tax=Arabidopsis lyrata subsp. lyrata TaxID=81972 RepID=UPI000A29C179|nr:uncharacterized protein LOC110224443 [Arabidopsis lyrata subsp. lyrata]|eukprot:XP_020866168.1 uncharacterized protein LOC110224443 [Arabidopsis lyrata subsp. lyrata]